MRRFLSASSLYSLQRSRTGEEVVCHGSDEVEREPETIRMAPAGGSQRHLDELMTTRGLQSGERNVEQWLLWG